MFAVQPFSYRVPRFSTALPVAFCIDGTEIQGVTENLSETGLLATFSEPVLTGMRGRLRLYVDQCWIEVGAEAAYNEFLQAGLSFRFASEMERRFLQTLVKVVSRANNKELRHS